MHLDDLLAPALVICILLAVGLSFACLDSYKRWEQFKIDHNCKLVSHISGDVFNTIGTDAKGNVSIGVGSTPDEEGWLCDDGVTYYR